MAGELQRGGSTVATHTGSGASAVVTIDNGVKFPAGHPIQFKTDEFAPSSSLTVTTTASLFLGTNLQVTITPKSTSNKLLVNFWASGLHTSSNQRGMHLGFKYDASFSSGNGTTLGTKLFPAYDIGWMYYGSNLNGYVLDLDCTISANSPVANTSIIIRPFLQTLNGDMVLFVNANSDRDMAHMTVTEIQG